MTENLVSCMEWPLSHKEGPNKQPLLIPKVVSRWLTLLAAIKIIGSLSKNDILDWGFPNTAHMIPKMFLTS